MNFTTFRTFRKYHAFQHLYTHKIIIFKLFRSLQLQFSGPTGINFRYSYSFVGLTGICLYSYSSVQLHKKWSSELFSENYSYSYIKKWISNKKCNDFKKNGNFKIWSEKSFLECHKWGFKRWGLSKFEDI